MARLTKADAARQLGISRTTLYKLIDQGRLSATPDGLIDTAELGRVVSTLDVHRERPLPPLDTSPMDTVSQASEHYERPRDEHYERPPWTPDERQLTSTYRDLVDILREQLQASQQRERTYQDHITHLTAMLDQAHQQNQRLLDAPRPAPPVPAASPLASRPPVSPDPFPSRSTARQRILALLRAYPDGLTPAEMRVLLGADRRLTNTCTGMFKQGLLRRVGRGRYVVA
jgi:hypothetical protein